MAKAGFFENILSLAILALALQLIEAQCPSIPTTCREAQRRGNTTSGVYTIMPDAQNGTFEVYCDQTTDGGGWTLFQRRKDGSVDFYRNWADYRDGFGTFGGEFWLGNDKIHRILSQRSRNELRIDVEDFDGNKRYAKYSTFNVGSASNKYVLTVSGYSGNAGDAMTYHSGSKFSSTDQDNDAKSGGAPYGSCVYWYKGGWWYKNCLDCNLNGLYNTNKDSSSRRNILWHPWKENYPLKIAEMRLREVNN